MVLSTFQENPCSVLIVLPFKFSQHTNKIRRKYFQLHFYSLPQRRNGWRGGKKGQKVLVMVAKLSASFVFGGAL
jgi:hypothetical protein